MGLAPSVFPLSKVSNTQSPSIEFHFHYQYSPITILQLSYNRSESFSELCFPISYPFLGNYRNPLGEILPNQTCLQTFPSHFRWWGLELRSVSSLHSNKALTPTCHYPPPLSPFFSPGAPPYSCAMYSAHTRFSMPTVDKLISITMTHDSSPSHLRAFKRVSVTQGNWHLVRIWQASTSKYLEVELPIISLHSISGIFLRDGYLSALSVPHSDVNEQISLCPCSASSISCLSWDFPRKKSATPTFCLLYQDVVEWGWGILHFLFPGSQMAKTLNCLDPNLHH